MIRQARLTPSDSDAKVTLMTPTPLTMYDVDALAIIVQACRDGARVRWMVPSVTDAHIEGVARSIGDERGNFAGPSDDIRDLYLRVSSLMEHFIPMADVIEWVKAGTFVVEAER